MILNRFEQATIPTLVSPGQNKSCDKINIMTKYKLWQNS